MPTLEEATIGELVELGKVEYSKVVVTHENLPITVLRKNRTAIETKDYARVYLTSRKAQLEAELAEIDALIAEADKAGV